MQVIGLLITLTLVFSSESRTVITSNNCSMVDEGPTMISVHCPYSFTNEDLEKIPQGTRHLKVIFERLVILQEIYFDGMEKLDKNLTIEGRRLAYIGRNAFVHLAILQKLTLSNTGLRKLPGYLFKSLKSLRTLNIIENTHLKEIHDSAFIGLEGLVTLNLSKNNIEALNKSLFRTLTSLRRLDLGQNCITTIDNKTFLMVLSLNYLTLDDNQLTFFPDYLFSKLKRLYVLSLKNNLFRQISQYYFKGLRSITKIFLSHNKINHIHDYSFYDLQKLATLDLSYNKLTYFNNSTSYNLKGILKLNLSNNYLSILDRKMMLNSTLQVFDASNNPLEYIYEGAFQGLPKLNWISLRNCNLTSLPYNLFFGLFELVRLDLSSNEINFYNRSMSFKDLKMLGYLFLDGNYGLSLSRYRILSKMYRMHIANMSLRTIPYDPLVHFKRLRYLHFQNNRIKEINVTFFCVLQRLVEINAYGNMLSTINPDLFTCLNDLNLQTEGRLVDVRNNPIQCSFFVMEVYRMLSKEFPIKADCVYKGKRIDASWLHQRYFTKHWRSYDLGINTGSNDKFIDTFPEQYCIVLKFTLDSNSSKYSDYGEIDFVQPHEETDEKGFILSIKIKNYLKICFEDSNVPVSCVKVDNLLKSWNLVEIYQETNGNTTANFVVAVNGEVMKKVEKINFRSYQDVALIMEKSEYINIQRFVLFTDRVFTITIRKKIIINWKNVLLVCGFLLVLFIIIFHTCYLYCKVRTNSPSA